MSNSRVRRCIDGTYHRLEQRSGYLWYAEPQQDELNQPVRDVPPQPGVPPIPLALLEDK